MKGYLNNTRVAVAAFFLSVLAVAGAIVLTFLTVDLGEDVTRIEGDVHRAPCVVRDLDDRNCVQQARRIVRACFADKNCRRIIETQRGRLRPERPEPRRRSMTPSAEGGGSSTGSPPPSQRPPSSGGGGGSGGGNGGGSKPPDSPPPSEPPGDDTLLGPIIDTACEPLAPLQLC